MSSFVSKVVAALHRPSRWLRKALRGALWLLAGLWLLLLTLWLLLYAAILPNLDRWRPEIEAQASQALGVSLRIGAIEVQTGGWMPLLQLRELRLLGPDGGEALRLQRVSAALSPRSLLAWPPRLEQLYLHEPELELRRDAAGQLWIAGLRLQGGPAEGGSPLLDWLLRQHEVAVQGGRLRWHDALRPHAGELQLNDLQLLMRNSLRRHELRVDATPPAALGARFSLRARVTQPLLARPGDWRRWDGLLYADLPQTQAQALARHVALPLQISQGQGSLRGWLQLARGQVREVDLDLALQDVRLRVSPQVAPLQLAALQTRLAWQRLGSGTRWSVRGLQFALPADEPGSTQAWPLSNATLTLQHEGSDTPWQPPRPAQLRGGQLQADRLDLGLLARVAGGLPLGAALHEALARREPQGRVQNLQASWSGALDAPSRWQLDLLSDGLALAPQPALEASAEHPHPLGQPGFRSGSLRLNASERGGQAQIALRDGALLWPGLFDEDQLPLVEAQLELSWRRDGAHWRVELPTARLDTPDARLQLSGSWQGSERPLGTLQLKARSAELPVTALPRYLPRLLALPVRQYLGDALTGGRLRGLQLELSGPLADFPFRKPGQGLFRVQAQLQDVQYAFWPGHGADATRAAYVSPWPGLEGLRGELRFEGPGLQLRGVSGRTQGLEISAVDARIDDLGRDPLVVVNGRWRGQVPDALAYLRATPLQGWTGEALRYAQGSGAVAGALQLKVPIERSRDTKVRGDVQLGSREARDARESGLQLRLRDDLPPFGQLRGGISYSERGVQLQGLQARFLGGDVRVSGGRALDGSGDAGFVFEAEGQASSEGLRGAREWPALAQLGPHLSGQADYQLRLSFKGASPELELRSSLVGLASSLPEPLRKGAAESWPLLLRVQPQGSNREAWGLLLGTQLRALLDREAGRTRRGAIRMGSEGPVLLPQSGVQLLWAAPQIDLDPWRQRFDPTDSGASEGGSAAWLPDRIELQTPSLRVQRQRLTQVRAGIERAANGRDWRLTLQSDQAQGEGEWRTPPGQPPQLQARLSRLALSGSDEAATAAQPSLSLLQDSARDPLPLLDLQVDAFELRGKQLGSLSVRADGAAAGRDWTLQRLTLTHPDAKLEASGLWRAAEGRTQLDWQLDISDSGRWLDTLGFSNTVRGGKGQMKGVLAWRGSPLTPSMAGLDGQFTIDIDKGQFLRADPGVARLLGILSLQSLPRRLLFDWRDVFSGGFAFDEFAGDVRIQQGVAQTQNLRVRGLQANVLMDGSADLRAETTELRILVVPNLDAGGATLAYTAVNPAIGLATFLAQLLLRKPIEAANTTHLRVSGPWSEPKVEKIERPLQPAATPASAIKPS